MTIMVVIMAIIITGTVNLTLPIGPVNMTILPDNHIKIETKIMVIGVKVMEPGRRYHQLRQGTLKDQ